MKRHSSMIAAAAALLLVMGAGAATAQTGTGGDEHPAQKTQQHRSESDQEQHKQDRRQAGNLEAEGAGAPFYVSPATVKEIQSKLEDLGQTVGPVDGIWGENTSLALKAFQNEHGLEPTGQLTLRTLAEFGLRDLGTDRPEMAGRTGAGEEDRTQSDWEQNRRTGAEETDRTRYGRPGDADREQSGSIEASSGAQLFAGRETVEQVIARLNEEGYDVGQQSASWSDKTDREQMKHEQDREADRGEDVDREQRTDDQRMPGQASADREPHAKPMQKIRWNDETRSALKRFQEENGIEPTGHLTFDTLEALGVNEPLLALAGSGQDRPGGSDESMRHGESTERERDMKHGDAMKHDQDEKHGETMKHDQDMRHGKSTDQAMKRRGSDASGGEGREIAVPVYVGPSSVRQVQQALQSAGHDPGQMDGHWGPSTSEAVRAFQKKSGLVPTGNLNLETVRALGVANELGDLARAGGERTGERMERERSPR